MSFETRMSALEDAIEGACRKVGRPRDEITLVAVSKTFPPEAVREAHAAGLREFGENRVQELMEKAAALADLDLNWHLVGSLQTNKAQRAAELSSLIHSVDRASLVASLARAATGRDAENARIRVLIQVNTTDEPTKGGVTPAALPALLDSVRARSELDLAGLMTIGPTNGAELEIRRAFALLRRLRDESSIAHPDLTLSVLSMGMSDDFAWAVAEGATHLRIGSRLFGDRG